MTTSQQVLILISILAMQAIAMGLSYWMGWRADQAGKKALLHKLEMLQQDLKAADDRALFRHLQLGTNQAEDIGGSHV